jgi:hypothetical protein
MLTRVYRYGPARQAISKGYVVAGPEPERIVENVVRGQASLLQRGAGVTLRALPRQANVIWFDTGFVWLHTARARAARFAELEEAVKAVAAAVRQAGALLLPNAVRTASADSWKPFLCSDQHILLTSGELETATLCNLLRLHLPVLIALTGRAGAAPEGVETLGSRRLSDSTHLHAPHYLISASPQHLKRVRECLRRDEGVPGMEFLDVYPATNGDSAGNLVEINFNDGQMLLSTVRAHALLYQALLIRARRRASEERLIPAINQRILRRNRACAIADGMQARFEDEPDDFRDNRPGNGGQRDRRQGRDRRGAPFSTQKRYRRAGLVLLEIVEQLQYEFQVLEAEYSEIAPLVQGPTLRRLGRASLQNESDLLRMLHRRYKGQPGDFVHMVAGTVHAQQDGSDLCQVNEHFFPGPAGEVKYWWGQFLRAAAADRRIPAAIGRR